MTNETNFKIEKDVRPPANKVGRKAKYPFGDMDVGDSFAIGSLADADRAHSCRFAASYYGTRNNKKFSVFKTADGYRCWRTA